MRPCVAVVGRAAERNRAGLQVICGARR